MSGVSATMEKVLKEFYRDKVTLFFTIIIPLFFVLVMPIMWGDLPPTVLPPLKGGLSLTMISFLIMIGGQSNLAGSIATDRGRGLYVKIASMPISPLKEGLGRILGIFIYLILGAVIIFITGLVTGGTISAHASQVLMAFGLYGMCVLSATGIGLIIASWVRAESAATHAGIALTLLTAFMGGMFLPYDMLPSVFQAIARLHPITSANAAIVYLLEGEQYAYYNPLNALQMGVTVGLSAVLFISGMILYSSRCWLKE
jgi:ABC-2 type transport system permease protein